MNLEALFTLNIYWQLPFLIVIISLVYSATRFDRWDYILREAFRWGLRMAGFLVMIGVILYFVALWIDRSKPPNQPWPRCRARRWRFSNKIRKDFFS